ncbi:MAG: hypothetical protein EU542_07290 [Promethearchaeota archaeon]|nr:MAG: hypothetical protein EU542_07290 [Candidatus Lokiarchaeota archaeon]
MDWSDFKFQNPNLSENYLKKVWNTGFIELFCCDCFKKEMLAEKGIGYFRNDFIKKKRKLREIL